MTTILLVAEGSSDVRRVRFLVDTWLKNNVEWFDECHPEYTRTWVGIKNEIDWLDIHDVHRLFRETGFPPTFGQPFGKGEIPALKKVRLVLDKRKYWPDVILWMRDLDTDPSRREQTREFVHALPEQTQERYLLAFANQCSEAWVLSGFVTSETHHAAIQTIHKVTGHLLPRDAHRIGHHHTHGGAEWCTACLSLDTPAAEEAALLRGWARSEDQTGLHDLRESLDTHWALRRSLGLSTHGVSRRVVGPGAEGQGA